MVFTLKIIFKFLNNKIFFIKAYNMILYYDLYVLVNEKKKRFNLHTYNNKFL